MAQERARQAGGTLVLRNEDLDRPRCRPEFVQAMLEDLRWLGFEWQEGPDIGGPYGPYSQSERMPFYKTAFERLRDAEFLYPCKCSRREVMQALRAPHAGDEEPVYPGTCRPQDGKGTARPMAEETSWRFRVRDGERVGFVDGRRGPLGFVAGKDFGDFIVWRHDGLPSYQLAVVIDDAAMAITEVVRGEDLLLSTARQLLLYRALALTPPAFWHCALVTDSSGKRLAKRHDALSLRTLRVRGLSPEDVRAGF